MYSKGVYSSPETVTATFHLLGVNECCGEDWESLAAFLYGINSRKKC